MEDILSTRIRRLKQWVSMMKELNPIELFNNPEGYSSENLIANNMLSSSTSFHAG
jgi:hypothetical protein